MTSQSETTDDERALALLGELFAGVDRLHDRVQEFVQTDPHPSSPLAGDDRAAEGWGMSSASLATIVAGIDHLQSIRYLMADAHVLPAASPFTLARTGIETGSAAVWMLAPNLRAERVMRRLKLVREEWRDRQGLVRTAGLIDPSNEPAEDREERLNDLARRVTGDPSSIVGSHKIERMIKQASVALNEPGIVTTWKVCSGLAHGRLWASLTALDYEAQVRDSARGITRTKLASSPTRVLWAATCAMTALRGGTELWAQRARSPYA